MELHSDPVTTVTDADGRFEFHGVDYTHHELIVKKPAGEQIAGFELTFSEGDKVGTDVTENGVNITYIRSTAIVTIDMALNAGESSTAISKVTVSDTPAEASGGTASALWWIIGGVVVAAIAVVIVLLLKKRK